MFSPEARSKYLNNPSLVNMFPYVIGVSFAIPNGFNPIHKGFH
jgi:hypothetical protein